MIVHALNAHPAPLKFMHDLIFYVDRERWGYRVFEISSGANLLCIVSPGKFYSIEQAGLEGLIASYDLCRVASRRNPASEARVAA